MRTLSRWNLVFVFVSLITASTFVTHAVVAGAQTLPPGHPAANASPEAARPGSARPEIPEEVPEDELAPAAVQIDVSNVPALLQLLYQATRETKEKDILARIEDAKKLVDEGADLKITDPQSRSALHWTVFGSSYATKPKVIVAYEVLADDLIQKGVEINHEDIYQDTAFDYLLYSPNFEMQTLLIENGASSGFLSAFYHFFDLVAKEFPANSEAAIALTRKADLAPGATLSIRLDVPVYSDRSRTGDPISGTVTYPLCKNGEQIKCSDGELLVPPGTKVNGTVLFATKAPDKYTRPRLVLDFSNIVHKSGQRTPLYARVLDVDNARETIRNNEILGIVQPHASTKASLFMAAAGAANPIAGYSIKGIQTIYGLSIRREVMFPAGTDLHIQVVRASMLRQKEPWDSWPTVEVDDSLNHLAQTAPLRTTTPGKTPSDLTNLMFIGSEKEMMVAFGEAGYIEADDLGVRTALKTAQATIRKTGYSGAPVSTLLLQGRPPDLVYQKSLDTFAKRHHIRIWKLTKTYNGRDVWVGAATHDIATQSERGYTKWTHRIDTHIDRERDWIQTDLLFAGTATHYAEIDRPTAPKKLSNATGDDIVTDGKMAVLVLQRVKEPGPEGPALTPRN